MTLVEKGVAETISVKDLLGARSQFQYILDNNE